MSVQFHPEYQKDFTQDLIDMFGDQLMTPEEIEAAKASTSADVASDLYGPQVAAFFRSHSK